MRILIVGMGNVGLMHGWALAGGGVDVTHIVRKGSLPKHAGDITMDVMDFRSDPAECYLTSYRPRLVDQIRPGDRYDLVMVATNHLQVVDAVRQYREEAPESDFLIFCANWNGPAEIDALLPRSRYLWGYSVFSGAKGKDGVLYANIQKIYRIGEVDGKNTERLQRIVETFSRAGIDPEIKEDIIEWLWIHQAINAGLLGTIYSRREFPSTETPMEFWLLIVRAVKDALKVLAARGVEYGKYPETALFLLEDDGKAAELLRRSILGVPHYKRIRDHSHLDANPEEMKRFYLDVLETGEALGVDMPHLASLKDKI
ncbi:MAG: ketopantoate reductase family protein [Syntrophaceae bacterium]|nr:ketopantoate reductase family protein [Syntrophaceae bacterium]